MYACIHTGTEINMSGFLKCSRIYIIFCTTPPRLTAKLENTEAQRFLCNWCSKHTGGERRAERHPGWIDRCHFPAAKGFMCISIKPSQKDPMEKSHLKVAEKPRGGGGQPLRVFSTSWGPDPGRRATLGHKNPQCLSQLFSLEVHARGNESGI